MVSNERKFIDQVMNQIFNLVSEEAECEITNQQLEIL
jgi:uncharacterized protein YlxP (DUF503 family)